MSASVTPPRYVVSLAAPAFVSPAAKPETVVRRRDFGDVSPEGEEDDEAAHDVGMAVRLQPLLDEFAGDVERIEAAAAEFEEVLLERRAEEEEEPQYDEQLQPIIPKFLATSRGDLVRRDPQFNHLRKWFIGPTWNRQPDDPSALQKPPSLQSIAQQRLAASTKRRSTVGGGKQSRRQSEGLPLARSTLSVASMMSFDADSSVTSQPSPTRDSAAPKRGLVGPHILLDQDAPTQQAREEAFATVLDLGRRARKARNLERVTISELPFSTRETHLLVSRVLRAAHTITHLALPHCRLSTASIIPLCRHLESGTSTLVSLDLSYNDLDELSCKALEPALAASAVTELSLRGNNNVSSDAYSTTMLYLLLGNRLHTVDLGFTGLNDNSVVKLCTVLHSRDTRVRSLNIDGADASQRVVLFLLDAIAETKRIVELSTAHIYNCQTTQFANRLRAILTRNKQLLADAEVAKSKPPPSIPAPSAGLSAVFSPNTSFAPPAPTSPRRTGSPRSTPRKPSPRPPRSM
uniref:Uncharacterized protein n=1 Tax=Neobodo designis TaxID=312471 RepID=A0A7S1R635_NEODS